MKVGKVSLAEAFDEILLDPTCSCDDRSDVFVFHKVQYDLTQTRRDQIRGVPQEDVTSCLCSDFRRKRIFRFISRARLIR